MAGLSKRWMRLATVADCRIATFNYGDAGATQISSSARNFFEITALIF
jgi:hypothetical protein